jgi:primosomal protein N' (replication factor Y) (superfamily II helicase)
VRVAHVVVDIPSRAIETPFDYLIPDEVPDVGVGSCVLVPFGKRPVVGYVISTGDTSAHDRLLPLTALLGGPFFTPTGAATAQWIAGEYVSPLSDAVRLFAPPGGTPKVRKVPRDDADGSGFEWQLMAPATGPVDDRWVLLGGAGLDFEPRAGARLQRAILDAVREGPLRAAELSAELGAVSSALRRLVEVDAVRIETRRRYRDAQVNERPLARPSRLTDGQTTALSAIHDSLTRRSGDVILLDGVTGSGKTEVYLQAIERVLELGRSACVLVPEISLTPQTVGRFRARFGGDVAVLHSRLSAGERFDQWELVREGEARIVVGARSALFAPMRDLGLIVIDEEHEPSYKQGSAPRYHARDVAAHMAGLCGATLVLGSASASMEARARCESGEWTRVVMSQRATGGALPAVKVVDMTMEFAAGHRSMFSRELTSALEQVLREGHKAVLFLNRRGFASFLLCRECGFVPQCDSCSTSLTYHDVGQRLQCHHCGSTRPIPAACPRCESPYLRQFGAGTQRVETELATLFPKLPVVRMDADTTKGRGGHEAALAEFESRPNGVLLGTQMIAKGLDYPEVTLVGVIAADTSLWLPDFRAGERTYQLLEQVAGRAGRGASPETVVFQTYAPDHPAIRAAAAHDPEIFYTQEEPERRAAALPPYGRLANVLVWGRDKAAVASHAAALGESLAEIAGGLDVLGPSPAPLERLKGMWRWHLLVKGAVDAPISQVLAAALKATRGREGVSVAVDVDPVSLL